MPSIQTLRREQTAIQFTPNSTGRANLQRNYNYSFIWLFLDVTYNAAAGAKLQYNHFANLIRNISIFGNGNTEFKNQDFSSLLFQTFLLTGGKALVPRPDITAGTNKSYTLCVLLPLESLGMNYISDTGLLSNLFQTLDIQVSWTDSSAVGTGITINSASLRVCSLEKIMKTNADGQLDGKKPLRLISKTQAEQITTSSEGIIINLPPNKWYENIQIDVLDGTTGNAVAGAVTKVKFVQGTDVMADIKTSDLAIDNQRRYNLDYETFKSVFAADIAANKTINPDAHFVLDFSPDGDYLNSQVTQSFNQPQLLIDTMLPSGVTSIKLKATTNYIEKI